MRNRQEVKRIALWFLLLIGAAMFGYWFHGFIAIDSCLDLGGRWNYDRGYCEILIPQRDSEVSRDVGW